MLECAIIVEVICRKCPPVPKIATPLSLIKYFQMVDKANLQRINENALKQAIPSILALFCHKGLGHSGQTDLTLIIPPAEQC